MRSSRSPASSTSCTGGSVSFAHLLHGESNFRTLRAPSSRISGFWERMLATAASAVAVAFAISPRSRAGSIRGWVGAKR